MGGISPLTNPFQILILKKFEVSGDFCRSFMPTHIGGEADLRFVYCAGGYMFVLHLLSKICI